MATHNMLGGLILSNKVVTLYRASTKQQTDRDNNFDIPSQKRLVKEYIESKGLEVVREFTEGGISGFKTKTDKRDALNYIKAMALDKQFDTLVVYHSDRIGRIADESPIVISFLNAHDVKVYSVCEGYINSTTHTDKLVTYVRFWQNEGESIKLSIRVSDYHKQAVKEGRFRGGSFIPYGFQLEDNGTKNFKGRNILDFVINEEEAEIIRLIYDLSIYKNLGQTRIAKYLNEKKIPTSKGSSWYSSTISNILNNPIYKGQFHMFSNLYQEQIYSSIQENLIIIPEEKWEENQRVMKNRKYKKNDNYIRLDNREENSKNTHGKLLLSGIIYCGHCCERLTTMTAYKRWKLKDGTTKTEAYYKYRCGSFYKKSSINCDGQTTYGRTRIEPIVIDETKQFMLELSDRNLKDDFLKSLKDKVISLNKNKVELESKLKGLNKELQVLKDEVANSLLGKGKFEPELLNEIINKKKIESEEILEKLIEIEKDIKVANEEQDGYIDLNTEILDWDTKFDNADFERQKTMLSKVINKVEVFKDRIEIDFSVMFKTYRDNLECSNEHNGRVLR